MTIDIHSPALLNPMSDEGADTLYLCPSDRAARAWHGLLAKENEGVSTRVTCKHVESWLEEIWSRAQIFGMLLDLREVLDPAIASALWQQAVRETTDFAASECMRIAKLAEDAWSLSHRYFLSQLQISAFAASDDNIGVYVRISTRVRAILDSNSCVTRAELPMLISEHAQACHLLLPARIVLTPVFSSDPALDKLWACLRQCGVRVDEAPVNTHCARPTQIMAYTEAATEMRDAIDWAARQLGDHPDKSVALIVPNLAASRDEWLRALRERFNPDQWWRDPATDREHFNLSAGEALADFPYVHCLITLLRAITHPLDTERIAQALLHPRWSRGVRCQHKVTRMQQQLLEHGLDHSRLTEWHEALPDAVNAWLREREQAAKSHALRGEFRAQIGAFARAMTGSAWLPRTDLFQLDEAWVSAGDRWQQLDAFFGPVSWQDALAELQRVASAMTFQPKAGTARLHVMGLLESAGVPLDIARLVGFDESVLPERLRPNPMLPRVWQRTANVGLGSHDEVDARAARLWRNWITLPGSLSISWANETDGQRVAASPIVRDLTVIAAMEIAPRVSPSSSPPASFIRDEHLPARAASVNGKALTARALEEQAQCPRRAAASRLGLKAWPEHVVGIPARVRGTLVHVVLAAVGQLRKDVFASNAAIPDDAAMMATASDALEAAVAAEKVIRSRVPESVWAIEHDRILKLTRQVIALDKTRSGFAVVQVEAELRASTFGQDFRVRLDRVDETTEAAASDAIRVVFDYKTGTVARNDWFAEHTSGRLAAPQLPLYAVLLAQDDALAAPVRAVGYIVVADDGVKYVGVGEDAAFLSKTAKDEPSWETLLDGWYAQLGALVDEVKSGVAEVAPLKGQSTCRNCDAASFCREPWSLAGGDLSDVDTETLDGMPVGARNE